MTETNRLAAGTAAAAALVGSVVLANWLTARFGFIPIGFGLSTTAGTLAAGAALALRDAVQDVAGRVAAVAVIVAGAGVSYLLAGPALALASAAAFAIAELADLAVYTPIRERATFGDRWWVTAVLVSGVVGAVVDTVVFLGIAFGWAAVAPAMAGQLVGKTLASLLFIAVGKGVANVVFRQSDEQPARA